MKEKNTRRFLITTGERKKKWKGRAVVGSGGRWGNNKRIKWKVHRNKVEDKKKVGQS